MQLTLSLLRSGIRFFRAATLAAAFGFILTGAVFSTVAQTTNVIALLSGDAAGTSSFTGSTNWSNLLSPSPATPPDVNAYYTTNFNLRTPAGGGSYVFGGDSLEVDSGGMGFKGYGTITVNNLVINGGKISNAATGGTPDTGILAGNATVTGACILDGGATGTGAGATTLNVLAPLSGSGGITISDYGTVLLSAGNSYTGGTTVSTNSTLKIGAPNAIPHGDLTTYILKLNAGTAASAVLDLNGFDTTVNDLASQNDATGTRLVVITNSVSGATNTLTVDSERAATYKDIIVDSAGGKTALTLTNINGLPTAVWTLGSPSNTYSGDTTINAGQLKCGASTIFPWGAGKGNVIVNYPGLLEMGGRSPQMNGLGGNGIIDNINTAAQGVGGHATVNCGSNDVSTLFSGVIQNTYYDGTDANPLGNPTNAYVQITKFGAGTLTLSGTNTFVGNVAVHNGILQIIDQNGDGVTGGGLGLGNGCPNANWPTYPAKTVTVDSTLGDAGIQFLATNGSPIVVDPSISFLTAGTNGAIANEAGNNIINGTVSLRTGSATTIRVDADTLTLAGNVNIVSNTTSRTLTLSGATNGLIIGVISDGSSAAVPNTNILSLTKSGAGIWTLSANDTYSGATIVNGGTLALNGSGAITHSPAITIAGGATFDVSAVAGFTLVSGQTLGNSTATGTINGSINAGSGIIALVYAAGTPALAVANGTLALAAGTGLTVSNTGTALTAGNYKIIAQSTGGNVTGGTLPAVTVTGGGLASGAAATLQITGDELYLNVTGGIIPQPQITNISLSGTSLVFSGTNGTTGQSFEVLSSTNPATPLAGWISIATNAFTGSSFNITNPVNPSAPQNFYRLRIP